MSLSPILQQMKFTRGHMLRYGQSKTWWKELVRDFAGQNRALIQGGCFEPMVINGVTWGLYKGEITSVTHPCIYFRPFVGAPCHSIYNDRLETPTLLGKHFISGKFQWITIVPDKCLFRISITSRFFSVNWLSLEEVGGFPKKMIWWLFKMDPPKFKFNSWPCSPLKSYGCPKGKANWSSNHHGFQGRARWSVEQSFLSWNVHKPKKYVCSNSFMECVLNKKIME